METSVLAIGCFDEKSTFLNRRRVRNPNFESLGKQVYEIGFHIPKESHVNLPYLAVIGE